MHSTNDPESTEESYAAEDTGFLSKYGTKLLIAGAVIAAIAGSAVYYFWKRESEGTSPGPIGSTPVSGKKVHFGESDSDDDSDNDEEAETVPAGIISLD